MNEKDFDKEYDLESRVQELTDLYVKNAKDHVKSRVRKKRHKQ